MLLKNESLQQETSETLEAGKVLRDVEFFNNARSAKRPCGFRTGLEWRLMRLVETKAQQEKAKQGNNGGMR
jgi:hypothetical protein